MIPLLLQLILIFSGSVWANDIYPLRRIKDLSVSYTNETSVRVSTANIVILDYSLLRNDFPSLKTLSDSEINKLILNSTAFVSESQLSGIGSLSTSIVTDKNKTQTAYRPKDYGRALLFPFDEGLIDAKGVGIEPNANHKKNGLMSLRKARHEYLIEKTVAKIFEHEQSPYRTVGCYGILDLGFDIISDGEPRRAGALLRQAHNRGSSESFLEKEILEIEPMLRKYGVSSATPNTLGYENANIQGNSKTKLIVDFGHYRMQPLESNPVLSFRWSAKHIPVERWSEVVAKALLVHNDQNNNRIPLYELYDAHSDLNHTLSKITSRIALSPRGGFVTQFDPFSKWEELIRFMNLKPAAEAETHLSALQFILNKQFLDPLTLKSFYQGIVTEFENNPPSKIKNLKNIFYLSLMKSFEEIKSHEVVNDFLEWIDPYLQEVYPSLSTKEETLAWFKQYTKLLNKESGKQISNFFMLTHASDIGQLVQQQWHLDFYPHLKISSKYHLQKIMLDKLKMNLAMPISEISFFQDVRFIFETIKNELESLLPTLDPKIASLLRSTLTRVSALPCPEVMNGE